MLLVKLPAPLPSVVLVLNATVGLELVLQHTPLEVTAAPPSEEILPPQLAEVVPILLGAVVIIVGKTAVVVVSLTTRTEKPYVLSMWSLPTLLLS